jgi:hypothetical protein
MRSNILSRKQLWRRTLIKHNRKWEIDEISQCNSSCANPDTRSKVDGTQITTPSDISSKSLNRKQEVSSHSEEIKILRAEDNYNTNSEPISVSFNPEIQECPVPSRKDYGPQLKDLYWHQEDFDLFKQDAVGEIRLYWRLSGTSAKDAIIALYQPEFDNDELVSNILYRNHSLYVSPSPTTFDNSFDSCILDEDQASDLEESVIEGTVMRHVDSLSSLHQHGFEATDSESTSMASSVVDFQLQSERIGKEFSDKLCCKSDGEFSAAHNQTLPLHQQNLQRLRYHQQQQIPSEHQYSYYCSQYQQQQQLTENDQRIARGGVWIDSEGDSDSIVSDSMDYDM